MPAFPRKVVAYDKEWKTAEGGKGVGGQAYERDLYTLNLGEPDENTIIEDEFLQRIDNDASMALDNMVAGNLANRGRAILARYIASLIMRNPKFIERSRQDMSRVEKEIYRRMYLYDQEFKDSLRQKFATEDEFQEAWQAGAPEHVEISGSREAAMVIAVQTIEDITEAVFKLPWTLLFVSGDDRFVIADDPVFCCNPTANVRSPVGMLTPGAETILPVSSTTCLVMTAKGSYAWKTEKATSWQVSEINTRSAYAASKRFFGPALTDDWKNLMNRFAKWDGRADFFQAPNLDISIHAVDNDLFQSLFP
jgi:hypothetical protein